MYIHYSIINRHQRSVAITYQSAAELYDYRKFTQRLEYFTISKIRPLV